MPQSPRQIEVDYALGRGRFLGRALLGTQQRGKGKSEHAAGSKLNSGATVNPVSVIGRHKIVGWEGKQKGREGSIIARRLEATASAYQISQPKVDAQQPRDIPAAEELIGQLELLVDLIPLIVQTDSMRSW